MNFSSFALPISNREGKARISRNVAGASSWVLSHVINCEGHANPEYNRDTIWQVCKPADTRREPMKPLFDAVVLTVKLNIAKAINLYLVGGEIGLSLLAARLVTEFSMIAIVRDEKIAVGVRRHAGSAVQSVGGRLVVEQVSAGHGGDDVVRQVRAVQLPLVGERANARGHHTERRIAAPDHRLIDRLARDDRLRLQCFKSKGHCKEWQKAILHDVFEYYGWMLRGYVRSSFRGRGQSRGRRGRHGGGRAVLS